MAGRQTCKNTYLNYIAVIDSDADNKINKLNKIMVTCHPFAEKSPVDEILPNVHGTAV